MNLSSAHQLRRMIPRWRSFQSAAQTSETATTKPRSRPTEQADEFLTINLNAWKAERSIENAVDLVSYGLVSGVEDLAEDAARFLLENGDDISPAQRLLAERLVSRGIDSGPAAPFVAQSVLRASSLEEVVATARREVGRLRRVLQCWPRSPIQWVELSRLYSIVGQIDKAEKAMRVAVGLAKTNRFVVRSAARLSVHLRDPEHALWLIRHVPNFHADPWLLASEIAISCITDRTSPFATKAMAVLNSDRFAPQHISELAGAVGTLEMSKGAEKRARNMFRKSLERPNDNSLAQAEWAAPRLGNMGTQHLTDVPTPYEALARHALSESNWLEAAKNAFRWAEDEPFSSGPAAVGSYVASALLEDYQTSLEFCDLGLMANPEDLDIKNNKVVALTLLGRLGEAIELLGSVGQVQKDSDNAVVLTATAGLVSFRAGNIEDGRQLYRKAAEHARRRRNHRLEVMAKIYLAREEVEAATPMARTAVEEAKRDFKGLEGDKEVTGMLSLLEKKAKKKFEAL